MVSEPTNQADEVALDPRPDRPAASEPLPGGGGRPILRLASAGAAPDDAAFVRRVRSGDASAASDLYARFATDVNRVIWKLLGGDSEHDDLVHDVFVITLTELRAGKQPTELGAWIVGIAVHRVRREIRRRGVRRRFAQLSSPFAPRATPPDVESPDLLRRLYSLLERLDADDRVAFSLRHLDRRSLQETAAASACSLATAKRRLQRARARLLELSRPYPELYALFTAAEAPERDEP